MSANPMPQPAPFDFKNPDYLPIYEARTERLKRMRANPQMLQALADFYRNDPASFINDFGVTHDPRNPERGLPASIPFLLFPKQRELIAWVLDRWRGQESALIEKSRDIGASWLLMALSCTLCLFNKGLTIGWGSRKEELLDRSGDPSSLFYKGRMFLESLPPEFLGGWDMKKNSAHMRLVFPYTGCAITGEAGDNIGRGGRTSMFYVDEAAYIERPQLVEASLSATTNCRIDVSSVNGMANPFAAKRFSGKVPVFTMHWRDDPRKDDAWYQRQVDTLDPVTVAQEIDISYQGSAEGLLIPSVWIQAAIGAHLKLGIQPTGMKRGGLDVADEGIDKNAFAGRHGILLEYLKSWSGKNSDIYATVVQAFNICDERGYETFFYDSDGLGSGVRGDARVINEEREKSNRPDICGQRPYIRDEPFRGSGAVWEPDSEMVPKRLNRDLFANAKAQSWWALRIRFQQTYRAVVQKLPYNADDLISIDPNLDELLPLTMELSQPTYSLNNAGKVLVDKSPSGIRSPNLADSVMICFQPASRTLETWIKLADD
jgi:phage terminase large subunit